MKKFIFKLAVFVLPIVLLGFFLDQLISQNLKKSNSHAEKEYSTWNDVMNGKLNAKIIINGSSRALVHFDPKIIENSLHLSTYNIGMDGQTFNMQYLRNLKMLQRNLKPKLIIHSVDIGTLVKGNLFNPDQFLPYMLWDQTFYKYMSLYDAYSCFDYYVPLIRYYGKFDALKSALKIILFPQNNVLERIKGYQPQDEVWNKDFDIAKMKMKKYAVTPDSQTIALFDNYLQECKTQKINVILVYSPYYIEGQKFITNQKQIISIYKKYTEKYGFSFLDFTKDDICFDKNYFYNASHLNKSGAEFFTRKLCSQLKKSNNLFITEAKESGN